ncbi:Hypoxanthine-guanine phosphoribosyltransferase [Georgfuchsia toluolica]|uniref:Hypoxanthine-guanine phosphoribosyltransferase n=1 Tax=Georgfuchsia toluolica TaxID=424218 RepID=A0A916J4G4_9PROT|nr:hypoxanthine-guanine phosphoribosyltransferase [Georgfuchsia toluolica]CAG4883818.1 Hypoxanthine-guanine phosphoribosyltransferase [Georgfuchsia toluolica]
MNPEEARRILDSAELIRSEAEVTAAVRRVAQSITEALSERNPLVLAVMGGATIFAGHLLPLLRFPLEYDYLHATRYGDSTTGGELAWVVEPRTPVTGRIVLLVDDILDEGITLAAIRERLLRQGAEGCYTAVFADKEIGRTKPIVPNFIGLTLPNRFVFGFGMDIEGAWRNLPAIYAVAE